MLVDKCPECGQFITPEASKELEEIIDSLENALVELKSINNINELTGVKAKVDKNLRKAEMYYGSNPKIKSLVNCVKEEADAFEKKTNAKNKKIGIFFIIFLLVIIIGGIIAGLMKG